MEVSNLGTLMNDDVNDKYQWKKTQRELEEMKTKIEQQVGMGEGSDLCDLFGVLWLARLKPAGC